MSFVPHSDPASRAQEVRGEVSWAGEAEKTVPEQDRGWLEQSGQELFLADPATMQPAQNGTRAECHSGEEVPGLVPTVSAHKRFTSGVNKTMHELDAVRTLATLREHPLGLCHMNWVAAEEQVKRDFDLCKYIAPGDCSAARLVLRASLLGPSRSTALMVSQIGAALLLALGIPIVAYICGGSTFFVAAFTANSFNLLGKLVSVRFQTLKDGGSIDNAVAKIWCIAPKKVSEPHRAALECFMSFKTLQPVGGPHGLAELMLPFIVLYFSRDQDSMEAWEPVVFWYAGYWSRVLSRASIRGIH